MVRSLRSVFLSLSCALGLAVAVLLPHGPLAPHATADAWSRVSLNGRTVPVSFNDGDSFRIHAGEYDGTQCRLGGFNTLESFGPAHFWGGWIGFTLDFLPLFGVTGARHNIHYGLAYAGHGVAQATLMGAMLAARLRGEEHPCAAALARRERDWPPEPLRWIAAKLLNGALSAYDRHTDRQLRRS